MAIHPPEQRIWWNEKLGKDELIWIAIAFLWGVIMFSMMIYWHLYGQQNLSTTAYRIDPSTFEAKTEAFAEVAVCAAPAICLPLLFATRAGHVQFNVPAALTEAGFTGPLLAPIGDGREIPADRRRLNGPIQGVATAGTVRNPIPPMI